MLRQNPRRESTERCAKAAARRHRVRHDAAARGAVGLPAGHHQGHRPRGVAADAGGDPLVHRHRPGAGLVVLSRHPVVRARRHAVGRDRRRRAVRPGVCFHLRRPGPHQRLAHDGVRLPRAAAHRARPAFLRARRAPGAAAVGRRRPRLRRPCAGVLRCFLYHGKYLARRPVRADRRHAVGRHHGADPPLQARLGHRHQDARLPARGVDPGAVRRLAAARRARRGGAHRARGGEPRLPGPGGRLRHLPGVVLAADALPGGAALGAVVPHADVRGAVRRAVPVRITDSALRPRRARRRRRHRARQPAALGAAGEACRRRRR